MANFSETLTFLRKSLNLSQQQIADATGLSRSAVGMYETGKREPDFETLKILANFLNVTMDVLTGHDSNERTSPFNVTRVPRLGAIACGEPILAEQNIEGYDAVPDYIKCDFTLVCKGDSMTGARIFDGDIVCIKQQPEVESGQIAAVQIGEDSATLKRVRFAENSITLWPENPAYTPLIFTGSDVEKVRILGLATHFISRVV